jgi:predicted permease
MGVRLSLGAQPGRLIKLLLSESAVLAVAGGLLGTTLAYWGTELVALAQRQSPLGVVIDVAPDFRVLAFALTVAAATVLVFGLLPAIQAGRVDPLVALRASGAAAITPTQVRIRGVLVGAQIALSTLLLVGALLFARTVRAAYRIDPGFDTENLLLVFASPIAGQQGGRDRLSIALELQERIAAMPGVLSVSWGSSTPLAGGGSRRYFAINGYQPMPGEDMEIHVNEVGPRFFETIGIPIIRGRAFDGTERGRAPDVAIVNESFAQRYWPGQDPIGQRLKNPSGNELTVIGVARDARYLSVTEPARPYIFLSALQRTGATRMFVRTARDPLPLLPRIARELEVIAPGWLLANPTTLHDQIGRLVFQQRAAGALIGTFAALAIILACVGLYGVVAFAVAQRTREIGIRVALGAQPGAVVQLFLRRTVPIVALGATAGIVGALMLSRVIASLLIGVTSRDPAAFIGGTLLLAAVAFLASWIPAHRATRVDPMTALRAE